MSFKLLKKNSEDKGRIEKLVTQLEKQEKGNYEDPTFWDFKSGLSSLILIVA